MKCDNCNSIIEINEFGGYQHFQSTKNSITENVKNGYMKKVSENSFETMYECNCCHTKWKLSAPDFPIMGYFISE